MYSNGGSVDISVVASVVVVVVAIKKRNIIEMRVLSLSLAAMLSKDNVGHSGNKQKIHLSHRIKFFE